MRRIRTPDRAIARRMNLIPFSVVSSEDKKDKDLAEKLQAEGSAILAWAVRGRVLVGGCCRRLDMQRLDYKAPGPEDARESLHRLENWILGISLFLLLAVIILLTICSMRA